MRQQQQQAIAKLQKEIFDLYFNADNQMLHVKLNVLQRHISAEEYEKYMEYLDYAGEVILERVYDGEVVTA